MQGIVSTFDDVPFDRVQDNRRVAFQMGPVVTAVAVAALAVCFGTLIIHTPRSVTPDVVASQAPAKAAVSPYGALASNPYGALVSNPYGEIFDPAYISGSSSASLSRTFSSNWGVETPPAAATSPSTQASDAPTPPQRDIAEVEETTATPLPPLRPADFGAAVRPAASDRVTPSSQQAQPPQTKVARETTAPADHRSFFEKLFGVGPTPSSGTTVAYSSTESRTGSRILAAPFGGATPAGYDRYTAVYDISARMVYLPDGTRLEAHSGLGERLDDPRFVSERNRGATPPHLYELTPREASFHGVQALRLKPIGGGDPFGRAGLLAHSYMLGPNGDSNGCVSFRDYEAFLRAYESGQVKRLAVVARLN
jgi:Protein of unknown function (DUF2778)